VYENLISQPTVTNDFLFQILFISAGLSLKEPLSREDSTIDFLFQILFISAGLKSQGTTHNNMSPAQETQLVCLKKAR
jgi:hypothetical protein